ncbi:probable prefoldin subunit 6 [Sitodiplosis mosellana]|uniref:probable prefoldin subunit 6 n=1 Tax=Sitodiplosis mosellana TaxID=263140 RepID=UPI002443B9E7|nr:probable prefoldin subunit 6 [Sitodiplosis mosellana]
MDAECKAIEKKMQSEVDQFKAIQKDFSKLVQQRELLDGQLNENKSVLEELNLLKDDNQVYKLYGPVLVKQDLDESRQNVGKRMDYIKKELKRCNDQIEELEKKQDKHRENIQKLQQKLQQQYQAVMAAAGMK